MGLMILFCCAGEDPEFLERMPVHRQPRIECGRLSLLIPRALAALIRSCQFGPKDPTPLSRVLPSGARERGSVGLLHPS